MILQSVLLATIGINSSLALVLVLQFDGSLRPPKDPIPGFASYTSSTNIFASDITNKKQQQIQIIEGSEKLASCGAAISLVHSSPPLDDNNNGHYHREEEIELIAVGGRYLPNIPGMNAADTEYDGLLLGLEWLVRALSFEHENGDDDGSDNSVLNEWNDIIRKEHLVPLVLGSPTTLILRGDCKAVIDQLKSRSVPRKMERKYNLAMERIRSIKNMYAEHQRRKMMCENNLDIVNDVAVVSRELSLCFEHVPRENNKFCDAVCKLVINRKQADIIQSIQDLIRLGEDDAASKSTTTDTPVEIRRRTKISKKKRNISHSNNKFFQRAMNKIRDNPRVCHSSRLALACELTSASLRQGDAAILSELSAFFLRVSRRWSRIYYYYTKNNNAREDDDGASSSSSSSSSATTGSASTSCCYKDTSRKVSIACEKLSRHFVGCDTMDEDVFVDNCDDCHEGIASVFELCTTNESKRNGEGMDFLAESAMLMPYVDISELISGIEGESWRNELVDWNNLHNRNSVS
eukprot:CAMPEP_0201662342 /NCGR_PEP_ID=MMETSP0494-20130426/4451_1 /ASSEMBLY_ACC=CAM_ASM_000839 /TAXON_ID=420259 /ORGANISM="Thalassiosira gravida, Strain GMp14c1" /LENGTH=519 /DNA_ID=CAMNT_0048140679 /DNA_START=281 /DNA_END=1840 /DNA_ORIENTATION=+